MSETSEEKELPPSPKKLRDAREKGQIATSRDMVTAVSAPSSAAPIPACASRRVVSRLTSGRRAGCRWGRRRRRA